MAFGAPTLKGRALRYLSQREHSRAELERKLARHVEDAPGGVPAAEQIAHALDELATRGLQSETRVVESVVRVKGARLGGAGLKRALQAKGVAPELIAEALAKAAPGELERAREVWRRRFGMPAADSAARAKQMRFLAARGFAAEVIREVVQGDEEGA